MKSWQPSDGLVSEGKIVITQLDEDIVAALVE